MRKQSHGFDIAKFLLIGSAIFQAWQFGRALNIYDPSGMDIGGLNIGGLVLGVLVNVAVAWASTKIPSINGKNRIRSAWVAFFGLMVISPLIVAPAMWIIVRNLPVGILVYFLAVGLSIAPDLTIALIGFLDKSLMPSLKVTEQPQSEKSGRIAKIKNGKKSHSETPCRYAGAGCELSGTQNAMNAHARFCKFKPTTIEDLVDVSVRKQ